MEQITEQIDLQKEISRLFKLFDILSGDYKFISKDNPYVKTLLQLEGKIKTHIVTDRFSRWSDGWIVDFKYKGKNFTLKVNQSLRIVAITMRNTEEESPVDITQQNEALLAKLFKDFRKKLETEAKDEARKYYARLRSQKDLEKEEELLERLHKKARFRRAQRELRKSIES